MENYQMFFPCSSSSSMEHQVSSSNNSIETSSYQMLPNNHNNPIDHQHHHQRSTCNNATRNDILGHYHQSNQVIISDDHSDSLGDMINNITTEIISEDKSSNKVIKKGEKKIRKHKYAFQTRSQVDILDDGFRWRKYGQKAVKSNKFPRSYYRCTYEGCNVKKQVQRLTKDEAVVITTYEGIHTHPIEKHSDNFEHILNQMQIYNSPI